MRPHGAQSVLARALRTDVRVGTTARKAIVRGFDVVIDLDPMSEHAISHPLLDDLSAEESGARRCCSWLMRERLMELHADDKGAIACVATHIAELVLRQYRFNRRQGCVAIHEDTPHNHYLEIAILSGVRGRGDELRASI